ncbi:MAG: ABC transporter ATP-binding protein [Deltaproteobacteria bacterium]|nr:MAG: ABC transporter ATP-binding protein [Deltaproteobacteria bacterium]
MEYIVIKNLRKEYMERRKHSRSIENCYVNCGDVNLVLDNISLKFKEGELVCIVGPSGCGKSTMLRIVAGFEKSTSGTVLINNKEVTKPCSDHIFVFQHSALLPWMNVWDNVGLGLRNIRDKEHKHEKIREYIEIVELEGFEQNYPYQLSGGMKRRAELARALAVSPDVLFMDEPFTGLDFLVHKKLREEVVNMHEYFGKTILVVTHDIDDALIMGDRIVIMSRSPSYVKLEQKLDFPRPRDFKKYPELDELRQEIYLMLGVPHAV